MRFGRVSSASPSVFIVAAAFAGIGLAAVGGCGGKKKPPVTADESTKSDSGGESFGEANPAEVADLDAGSGKGDAGGGAASTPPSAAPEVKDECTSVGIDFEKRARPKLKDCYAAGKKKDANLQGTVKIVVEIGPVGKVKSIKITEKTLPDPVAQCMLKVVKATPLPEASKCPGKMLTLPITFPTPH